MTEQADLADLALTLRVGAALNTPTTPLPRCFAHGRAMDCIADSPVLIAQCSDCGQRATKEPGESTWHYLP